MSVADILKSKGGAKGFVGIPNRRLNQPVRTSEYTGKIGIEIELEGAGLPSAGYMETVKSPSGVTWDVKNDGSLRGGLEYVLHKPCEESEIDYLISGLFRVFVERGTHLNPSNRCSLHVHYNVSGLKANAITSIIALWTVFEEPLLRWWGNARYKNHFCLSTKDEEATLASWEKFLRTGVLPEERNLRYSALNLVAIRSYGSLEFRGGGAIVEPNKGITWARFIHKLCKFAEDNYPNPRQLAFDISERGPQQMFKDICGDEFEAFYNAVFNTVDNFSLCCTESFHNVQPILFEFPWPLWLEEISKPYIPNPFSKKNPSIVARNTVDGLGGWAVREITDQDLDRRLGALRPAVNRI